MRAGLAASRAAAALGAPSLVTLVIFASLTTAPAGTNRFTAEILSRSEVSTNLARVLWHPSGKQITYLRARTTGNRTNTFLCGYDVATGQESVLFDPGRGPTNRARLALSSYQWSPSGDAILINSASDLWRIPITSDPSDPEQLTHDAVAEELPAFSPDGAYVAFVRQNNLFAVNVRSRRTAQLTFDGGDAVLNGKLDWVYGEEFSHLTGSPRAYEWSPDGRTILFLRLEEMAVPEYAITDFLRTHPPLRRQRYPKAGDPNPRPSVRLVRVDQPRPLARIMPLSADAEYVLPEFSWTPDGKSAAVMTLNRTQNELTVHLWKTRWGKPRVLLREKDPCWINVFEPPRFLNDNRHFLWASERDGWYHCYLGQSDGSEARPLTHGPWQIEAELAQAWSGKPFEIDPTNQWIYFSATEKDPRERQLYRVRLDGSDFARLTREPGTHFQKLSPDGRYLLESFSSVNQPPALRLLRSDGTVVCVLEQREDRWKDYAKATAEFREVTALDGAKLYGQLTKPPDFDPAKRYPVILYVYGGPQAQVVRDQWPAVSSRNQLLAQEGFLIWSLDNRGSWGRGHAWETVTYRQLGTNELADQLAGVAYLKTLPFVDTNRFGIWGWSYGGYLTLYALTHAPDVFQAGVAGAPVTDWKYYDTIYTERYMRQPAENLAGYRASSPLEAADQLRAKLLVIHGTADDNVHLQNTMNFLDALIRAGRPYELQIQPGQMHGFAGERANEFVAAQLVDFFKRTLR